MENLKFTYKHIHNPRPGDTDYFIENAFKRGQVDQYMHHSVKTVRTEMPERFAGVDAVLPSVITVCIAKDESGNEVGIGYSFCSWKDNFNKKVGRNIARNRAIEDVKRLTKENFVV